MLTMTPKAMQHADDGLTLDDPAPAADEPEPGCSPGFHVDLTCQRPDVDPPAEQWLDEMLARVAHYLDLHEGSLSVAVVDDAVMADLHGQYKGDATTTDVLSFDLRDQPDAPMDGELIVCLDEAERQAARRGHATRVELLLYALHGMLHLLGYDDRDADTFEQMHAREDEILEAIGVGAVFLDGPQ